MRSILLVKGRTYRNQLKLIYPKYWKISPNFLLHFWNLHYVLKILNKKISLIADVFPKLENTKNVVTWTS